MGDFVNCAAHLPTISEYFHDLGTVQPATISYNPRQYGEMPRQTLGILNDH